MTNVTAERYMAEPDDPQRRDQGRDESGEDIRGIGQDDDFDDDDELDEEEEEDEGAF